MIPEIKFSPIYSNNAAAKLRSTNSAKNNTCQKRNYSSVPFLANNRPASTLSSVEKGRTLSLSDYRKFAILSDFLKDVPKSENSPDLTPVQQLNYLLNSGILLSKSNHDNSTVLDNLYSIATKKRAYDLDRTTIITNVLDLICHPKYVTQTFGDIPDNVKVEILKRLPDDDPIKKNPEIMDVDASGTCAAASLEVNMAHSYPAEFTRWVSELSSEKMSLDLNVKLNSISKNPLEALKIINILKAQSTFDGFDKIKVKVDLDKGAMARAYIQSKYWDIGERNVADVLIQSAIMKLGSQNTYNSLTDIRAGDFNQNPQGLIEVEKTFVESLIKNKEITSLIYHQIDDDQNLVGYNCSMDKIAKHITQTIDSGDDVILGYVLTNETSGATLNKNYNLQVDGKPNKVTNGHEITVIDYKRDNKGNLSFICVDTDDDNPQLVTYSAEWLLPKIHHAGYPAHIVKDDEEEIMRKAMS